MTDHIVSTSEAFIDLLGGDTLTVTPTGELGDLVSVYAFGNATITNAGRIAGSATGIVNWGGWRPDRDQ